jgi:arylsulfatase A-like enzyme
VLAPNVPEEPDAGRARKGLDDLRAYYAMIENLDDNVGALVRFLDERALREHTAIVLLSDHGDLQGSHGLHGKQQPYEESGGVPLIVAHPAAGIDGGRVLDEVTCAEDWFPTLRGLAGLPPLPGKPGLDLTPRLRGGPPLDRDGVLLELVMELRPNAPYFEQTWRAWRTERFKYVVLRDERTEAGAVPRQLFDLRHDPYEQRNLVADPEWRDVAASLHARLGQALAGAGDDFALSRFPT